MVDHLRLEEALMGEITPSLLPKLSFPINIQTSKPYPKGAIPADIPIINQEQAPQAQVQPQPQPQPQPEPDGTSDIITHGTFEPSGHQYFVPPPPVRDDGAPMPGLLGPPPPSSATGS